MLRKLTYISCSIREHRWNLDSRKKTDQDQGVLMATRYKHYVLQGKIIFSHMKFKLRNKAYDVKDNVRLCIDHEIKNKHACLVYQIVTNYILQHISSLIIKQVKISIPLLYLMNNLDCQYEPHHEKTCLWGCPKHVGLELACSATEQSWNCGYSN